jgi:hypothetical protein
MLLTAPVLAALLIGHVVGDYFLQPLWMAEKKSTLTGKGATIALIHSMIYTACVCVALWTINPATIALVMLSHFPIDAFGVAGWWCRHVLHRHYADVAAEGGEYRDVRVAFACIVYVVVDNSMHLIILIAMIMAGLI